MPPRYEDEFFEFEETVLEEERNGMFDILRLEDFDNCPECGCEGPLILRRKGYTCPECKTVVLEH